MLGKCYLRNSLLLWYLMKLHLKDLIFSLRRIKNNINQLARIAEQSQDLQALRAMIYSVQMIEKYEKSFLKYHKTKKARLLSKVDE